MGSPFKLMILIFLLYVNVTDAQKTNNNESTAGQTSTTQQPLPTQSAPTSSTSASTSTPTTTTPAPTPEPLMQNFSIHESAYCTCDLYPLSCDMDCCCDHKCTEKDRRFFGRCIEEKKFAPSDQSCYSSSIIHSVSSLNQFVTSPSPRLFCVQYSNVKKQDFFDNRKPFSSFSEIKSIRAKHPYGWFDDSEDGSISGSSSRSQSQQFLKSGDVMHLLSHRDSEDGMFVTKEWSLPYSLITGSGLCDSRRSIRFMQSISTSCLRYIFSLEENCKTFLNETLFEGRFVNRRITAAAALPSTVTHSEQSLTTTGTRQSEKSSPSSLDQVAADCLPHHHCLPVRDSQPAPSIKSHFLFSQTQPACFNAVRKVTHEIFYDTDNGVIRIETHYQRINLTGSRGYLRQFFQVKFTRLPSATTLVSNNDTGNVVAVEQVTERRLSGNPGYIMSAPVLAAVLPKDSAVTNESAAAMTAAERTTSVQGLRLPVLSGGDGTCSQSAIKIQDVSFGENFRSSCFVKQHLLVSLSERSDNVCQKLQQHMTSILQSGNSTNVTHVGVFGNSAVSRVSEWITILNETEWPQVRDASRTAPLSLSRKCPFLVTGFSYEIYFSFTGLIDQPQAKILSVVRRYSSRTRVWIPSKATSENAGGGGIEQSEQHHVEVSTSVSFFDMTHSRRTSFAPAPVLRLQLPADFFYPFFINFSARPEASLSFLSCSIILLLSSFCGKDAF